MTGRELLVRLAQVKDLDRPVAVLIRSDKQMIVWELAHAISGYNSKLSEVGKDEIGDYILLENK